MLGMNTILHAAAALAMIVLVWLALRYKAQRDLLRTGLRGRVTVASPKAYLEAFAGAWGIPFELGTDSRRGDLPPRRIDQQPLAETASRLDVRLIRWRDAGPGRSERGAAADFVVGSADAPLPAPSAELIAAMGPDVTIAFTVHQASSGTQGSSP